MTTNAMPTVTTAIHRAVEPMPAMSMLAPRIISGTASQRSKGFITAPPFAPRDNSANVHGGLPAGHRPEPLVTCLETYDPLTADCWSWRVAATPEHGLG